MAETHEPNAGIVAEIRAPAPNKVKAYTALHRTSRDGPWYMSGFIYRDARKFDELRIRCAESCDMEGDSYGAAMWREALFRAQTMLQVCDWPDGTDMDGVAQLMRYIDAALAAPPRNCDIVPIEAREAADMFHRERPLHGYDYETHDWLLSTATEKEGVNDADK